MSLAIQAKIYDFAHRHLNDLGSSGLSLKDINKLEQMIIDHEARTDRGIHNIGQAAAHFMDMTTNWDGYRSADQLRNRYTRQQIDTFITHAKFFLKGQYNQGDKNILTKTEFTNAYRAKYAQLK